MKTQKLTLSRNASFLALALALSASSLAAAQDTNTVNSTPQSTTPERREAHPSTTENECANAPNNVGQVAVENAQPTNPSAPPQLTGAQNEQNPARQRNENPELAQNEDNCFDAHEDPSTNENVRQ